MKVMQWYFLKIFSILFLFLKKLILKLLQFAHLSGRGVSFLSLSWVKHIKLSFFFHTKTDLRIYTVVEKEGIVRRFPFKGGSLEITSTVPLSLIGLFFIKNGGPSEARKRVLAQLPISAQSYSPSPLLDLSLFSYDEKWVSVMERPKACGEHPIR